jgi:hypothetical protein
MPTKQGGEELLTAAVERGPSEGARSGSKESSLLPCASPSEAARCASTEDHQAPSHPLFREQEDDQAVLSPTSAFPLLSSEGGLLGLPLRAFNEGLLRPRVARAQETNRLPTPATWLSKPIHKPLTEPSHRRSIII